MTEVSKPVTVKVIVHLDNGQSLAESLELPEDIQSPEEIELHIWEDIPND